MTGDQGPRVDRRPRRARGYRRHPSRQRLSGVVKRHHFAGGGGAPSSYVIVRKAVTAKKIKVAQVEKVKKGKK